MGANKKPLFSIIIPTYNHAHLIHKCLTSLIEQSQSDWEAIVINNYSLDDTLSVIENIGDQRIKVINFHNNGIIAASRNQGILKSRGEWLCFLDSDDFWYPEKLDKVSQYLDNNDLIYHDLDMFNKNGFIKGKKCKGRKLTKPLYSDLLMHGNPIATSSVVVRRKIIEQVSGFIEEKKLIAVEDYDLWLRVSKVTERFCYIPESLGAYWSGGGNITEVSVRQIKRKRAVLFKHLKNIDKKLKHHVIRSLFYERGRIYHKIGNLKRAKKCYLYSLGNRSLKINLKALLFSLRLFSS